jgi:acetyltransferase-like isoleucine patch superfamily enzyme
LVMLRRIAKRLFSLVCVPHLLARGVGLSQVLKNSFDRVTVACSADVATNLLDVERAELARVKVTSMGLDNSLSGRGFSLTNSEVCFYGSNCRVIISPGARLYNCRIIIIGEHGEVTIGENSTIAGARMVAEGRRGSLRIGARCMISDNVEIWATDSHALLGEKHEVENPPRPISIGQNCWIGAHVKMLKGASVEANSVIGMGAVLMGKNYQSGLIVGNPARRVRHVHGWRREHGTTDA